MSRTRNDIINTIGSAFLTSNHENDEWSYPKALKDNHKTITPALVMTPDGKRHKFLDLRFIDDVNRVAVLVETKTNYNKDKGAEAQLQAYVEYERVLTGYKIIAILANTNDDRIKVWKDKVDLSTFLHKEKKLKSMQEYQQLLCPVVNDREEVMRNTYYLNELMHTYGIDESIRSQLVGTCLLSLKRNVPYEDLTTQQVIGGMKQVLEDLLQGSLNKAEKLLILNGVLNDQNVKGLKDKEMESLMGYVKKKILPFINEKTTQGQDLLNLFFTIFNKYVGRKNKNQAFTPDHIVDFMCKAVGINRNSIVLDPCCGSGSFLVRALTMALADCSDDKERDEVKKRHILGIEFDDKVFGLATTNMLIHGDGNSNVRKASCFDETAWLYSAQIDRILMNPPYNGQRNVFPSDYVKNWPLNAKEDPSQGFYFVYKMAKAMRSGKLAVLLPMQCAINTKKTSEIYKFKELMLQEHTLDAVFSLPPDIFYPGANASACCMIFEIGVRHEDSTNSGTFFGYYKDDGFIKKKNLGRVEMIDKNTGKGKWKTIEELWLELYRKRKVIAGMSAVYKVTADDEWCCEAYMETDYISLTEDDFKRNIRDYLAYTIRCAEV